MVTKKKAKAVRFWASVNPSLFCGIFYCLSSSLAKRFLLYDACEEQASQNTRHVARVSGCEPRLMASSSGGGAYNYVVTVRCACLDC